MTALTAKVILEALEADGYTVSIVSGNRPGRRAHIHSGSDQGRRALGLERGDRVLRRIRAGGATRMGLRRVTPRRHPRRTVAACCAISPRMTSDIPMTERRLDGDGRAVHAGTLAEVVECHEPVTQKAGRIRAETCTNERQLSAHQRTQTPLNAQE